MRMRGDTRHSKTMRTGKLSCVDGIDKINPCVRGHSGSYTAKVSRSNMPSIQGNPVQENTQCQTQ